MTPVDYERMANRCAKEADGLAPGPERDELLRKVQKFRSYAKMENWVASPALQPPE
jgi:hypothetical protein